MKKFLILVVLSIVILSCATIPPQISEFKAVPAIIDEGGKTTITWNIIGADNVNIEGIGENLSPVGSKEIALNKTETFMMTAMKGKESVKKMITVEVKPKIIEKPKSIPVVEKRNLDKTVYVKGIVNAENVKAQDDPLLSINLIDVKGYPNKIKLYCTVKDQNGNHVANLAPPYNNELLNNWKSVFEEIQDKDIRITDFSVEEVREDVAPPFTTTFVLDYSGSMNKDYLFVNSALKKAISYIRPNKDNYEVVQFDDRVYKSVDITSNPDDINKIYDFEKLAGYTAFYTASNYAFTDINHSNKEKVAILFTDGGDNASLFTAYDVVMKARETGTKVFVIGFNRNFGGYLDAILTSIAEQTGGKTYFPEKISELDDIFAEIYQIMKVYYIISYTTKKTDGNIRYAKLNFEFPGFNKLLTATKKYYVNPEPIKEDRILSVARFETGKSDIKEDYKPLIEQVAQLLKENPNKKISIIGHTDTQGSDALNLALSKKRAKALANIFYRMGVKKSQILKIDGKGKKEPIYPNEENDYEKLGNRRVDISLV